MLRLGSLGNWHAMLRVAMAWWNRGQACLESACPSWCPRDWISIICLPLAVAAELFCYYVAVYVVIMPLFFFSPTGVLHMLVWHFFLIMVVACHVRAIFSDPGLVPLPSAVVDFSALYASQDDVASADAEADDEHLFQEQRSRSSQERSVCSKCNMYRPLRAHHCSICNRCVRNLDHHCPWIANCVGEDNQKHFILFLFYTLLLSLHGALLASIYAYYDYSYGPEFLGVGDAHSYHASVSLARCLGMAGLVFGAFVSFMLYQQVHSVINDVTYIETLQKACRSNAKQPISVRLTAVFGEGPSVYWLLPTQPRYPRPFSQLRREDGDIMTV